MVFMKIFLEQDVTYLPYEHAFSYVYVTRQNEIQVKIFNLLYVDSQFPFRLLAPILGQRKLRINLG